MQCQLTLHLGQFRLSDKLTLPLLLPPKPPPPVKRKGHVASRQWRRAEAGAGRHGVPAVPWLALRTLLGPDSCRRPGVLRRANLCFILPAPGKLLGLHHVRYPVPWLVKSCLQCCSQDWPTVRQLGFYSVELRNLRSSSRETSLCLTTRLPSPHEALRTAGASQNSKWRGGAPASPLTASHSPCPDASTPHATAASPTGAKQGKQDDTSRLTCLLSLLHRLLGSEKTVFPDILVRSTLPLPATMTRPAKPFYWHAKRADEEIQIICSDNVEHKA